MKKTSINIFLILSFCLITFGFGKTNFGFGAEYVDTDGVVKGEIPLYRMEGQSLGDLLKLPRPKLFLEFEKSQIVKLESSESVRIILDSHWKDAVTYFYNLKNKKASKSEWSTKLKKAKEKLQTNVITTPNGNRNISKQEANNMLYFLNDIASQLMERSNNYSELKIIKKASVKVGNCSQDSGTIDLEVTFDKSAKITDVKVRKASGCRDFDENSIKAVKSIEFEPAKSNGKAVTVTRNMTFNFSKY